MPSEITDNELLAWDKACQGAFPEPWWVDPRGRVRGGQPNDPTSIFVGHVADSRFSVTARSAMPRLIKAVEHYRDRQACHRRDLAKIEEALADIDAADDFSTPILIKDLLSDVRQMQRELQQANEAKAA